MKDILKLFGIVVCLILLTWVTFSGFGPSLISAPNNLLVILGFIVPVFYVGIVMWLLWRFIVIALSLQGKTKGGEK